MISNNTLLVVGAGASKEAGLPIGSELAEQIARLLTYRFDFGQLQSGDEVFLRVLSRDLKDTTATLNDYLSVASQISKGVRLVNSIDNYILRGRPRHRTSVRPRCTDLYSRTSRS